MIFIGDQFSINFILAHFFLESVSANICFIIAILSLWRYKKFGNSIHVGWGVVFLAQSAMELAHGITPILQGEGLEQWLPWTWVFTPILLFTGLSASLISSGEYLGQKHKNLIGPFLTVLVLTMVVIGYVFQIKSLYTPYNILSRPVDLGLALMWTTGLVLARRSPLVLSQIPSTYIGFFVCMIGGHLVMAFGSHQRDDPAFWLSHALVSLAYIAWLAGTVRENISIGKVGYNYYVAQKIKEISGLNEQIDSLRQDSDVYLSNLEEKYEVIDRLISKIEDKKKTKHKE
jgi:hypothetical protein